MKLLRSHYSLRGVFITFFNLSLIHYESNVFALEPNLTGIICHSYLVTDFPAVILFQPLALKNYCWHAPFPVGDRACIFMVGH